ncbi:hypothetical protein RchiOBHm_Chr1g0360321 [Rosa chinensis]|uniref:Uncharacterized protein n=1 Tax=Rosa chinensis TaxID=74649 RepID=A0A2P6SIL4_ROSCH|nr:hypothetical protein RchiOBHm_Chr1g0360321 [Rosa chinensis]
MGRKKKFIDKKKATFQLISRDSSDPNDDDSLGDDRVFIQVFVNPTTILIRSWPTRLRTKKLTTITTTLSKTLWRWLSPCRRNNFDNLGPCKKKNDQGGEAGINESREGGKKEVHG